MSTYLEIPNGVIVRGDCLNIMSEIEDGSIDMVLADVPYGTTACKWDSIIPLEPMWEQLKRVIKPNGAIVMTASQPFTSVLVNSNMQHFKYDWVWRKDRGSNFLNAKRQPLRNHESVLVFYGKQPTYNRQFTEGKPSHSKGTAVGTKAIGNTTGDFVNVEADLTSTKKNPKTVIEFNVPHPPIHPTQKPVALMEYLIKTYTNEGETVLDFTMGSGTTGVACKNLGRKFVGIELDKKYFEIAKNRILTTD